MSVFTSDGDRVVVFQFEFYDIRSDEIQRSKRWATQDFIDRYGAIRIGAGVPVEAGAVKGDGLTERGFDPNRRPGGFQTQVS
jgi:hypothetical protein